jgi:hypothetical protein
MNLSKHEGKSISMTNKGHNEMAGNRGRGLMKRAANRNQRNQRIKEIKLFSQEMEEDRTESGIVAGENLLQADRLRFEAAMALMKAGDYYAY